MASEPDDRPRWATPNSASSLRYLPTLATVVAALLAIVLAVVAAVVAIVTPPREGRPGYEPARR